MPILTTIALIQLAAACPGEHVPAARLLATARRESAFQTTAIHDNATGKTFMPASVTEAVDLAKGLLAQGHRIDAGVMQVTNSNWAMLGLTVETAFDPQRNVCAGQAVISEAYRIERAVSCRYNTGKPVCGAYADKIETAMQDYVEPPQAPAPVAVTVTSRPLGVRPPAWDVYASARQGRETRTITMATKE